jgi:hypothetical protein
VAEHLQSKREAEFKKEDNKLVNLTEEISQQHSTQAVA